MFSYQESFGLQETHTQLNLFKAKTRMFLEGERGA